MPAAPDLRRTPPRRWSDDLGGVTWLPRLIDKARAAQAGTLGTYLYGESPIDEGLLRAFGIGHDRFSEIVRSSADDAAILAQLRDLETFERGAAWSRTQLRRTWGWVLPLIDRDDGYIEVWFHPFARRVADSAAGLIRRWATARKKNRPV